MTTVITRQPGSNCHIGDQQRVTIWAGSRNWSTRMTCLLKKLATSWQIVIFSAANQYFFKIFEKNLSFSLIIGSSICKKINHVEWWDLAKTQVYFCHPSNCSTDYIEKLPIYTFFLTDRSSAYSSSVRPPMYNTSLFVRNWKVDKSFKKSAPIGTNLKRERRPKRVRKSGVYSFC